MTRELGWLWVDPGGRVFCARQGEEVDLERCLGCNWLLDLDRAAGPPALRCGARPPVPDGRDARAADRHVD